MTNIEFGPLPDGFGTIDGLQAVAGLPGLRARAPDGAARRAAPTTKRALPSVARTERASRRGGGRQGTPRSRRLRTRWFGAPTGCGTAAAARGSFFDPMADPRQGLFNKPTQHGHSTRPTTPRPTKTRSFRRFFRRAMSPRNLQSWLPNSNRNLRSSSLLLNEIHLLPMRWSLRNRSDHRLRTRRLPLPCREF